jgi:Transposase domain (DUF772)
LQQGLGLTAVAQQWPVEDYDQDHQHEARVGAARYSDRLGLDRSQGGAPLQRQWSAWDRDPLCHRLFLLKHIYGLSDEGVCERWVFDPYFQNFTGEEFFQHEFPHERSDLSHWRKRPTHDARKTCEVGSPFSLPSVSNADIQSQRLLTNSTFTTLHQHGDFGDRGLTLRVHFQVANVSFRPSNPLAASIRYLALHCHDFLPPMLSYSCNKQFGLVLDGVGLVNGLCSTNCHVASQLAVMGYRRHLSWRALAMT